MQYPSTASQQKNTVDIKGKGRTIADTFNAILNLKKETKLEKMHIRNVMIGLIGAKELAKIIRHNPNLSLVDLSGNRLGPQAMPHIADALRSCPHVKTLNLSGNEIRDEGAIMLASLLRRHPTITECSLHNNNIGEKGKKALREAVTGNTKLTINVDNESIRKTQAPSPSQAQSTPAIAKPSPTLSQPKTLFWSNLTQIIKPIAFTAASSALYMLNRPLGTLSFTLGALIGCKSYYDSFETSCTVKELPYTRTHSAYAVENRTESHLKRLNSNKIYNGNSRSSL
jgi:hypothetical protein